MNNSNANISFDKKIVDGFEYTMTDFYLTAFLVCEHAKLDRIVIMDRGKKKCGFILSSKKELEPVIKDFFNDKLMVNPQKYKDKIVSLKSLLHETKDREGLNKNTNEEVK